MVQATRKRELLDFYAGNEGRRSLFIKSIQQWAADQSLALMLGDLKVCLQPPHTADFTTVRQAYGDAVEKVKCIEETMFLYTQFAGNGNSPILRLLRKKLIREKEERAFLAQYVDQPLHAVNLVAMFCRVHDYHSPRLTPLLRNILEKMKQEN